MLETLWKLWKNDYLLNLRERSQIKLKWYRVDASQIPGIGEVIQIKENIPRGSWKIGEIVK